MKNRLALLAILVLVTSFTIPAYAETITVSLISDKEIPYDDSSILIRADVIVDEFDASVGQYFMKIVKLYPSPIPTLTEQKIYLKYLSNDVWKGQIGYMLNDKRVGQYEIQVYSESGSATGSAIYSIVESKPAPEPGAELIADLEEKLEVKEESEIKKPLMLVEKENILKLSAENKELVSSKNYQAAIEKSNEILEINPHYLDALTNKGTSYYHLGDLDNALLYYDKALTIDGNFFNALLGKGTTLNDLERYDEAMQILDRALEINPGHQTANYNKQVSIQEINALKEENEFQTNLIFIGIIVAIAGGVIFALKKRGKKQGTVVGPALKIKNF